MGQKGQFCEIYLQELFQALTVNNEEKSPCTSGRGRGKGTNLKYPDHSVFLNKDCPQEKPVNQSPICWGIIRT